ncbi:amino acid adenylation domain-containing protein [Pseudomonas sp. BW16M2]|uniref:amino acid adenylation domain-containing protein n=1 Tax=Pseudomonas sp. BW16M2 TaxID=2745489 RepID=UPI001645A347|nr:non-ribosomal peptide synthetase [Pseudomonas sp. BW16M2]MBC3437741.1 amino acid adenylation domain-containing protein [Pseudomonas sp. BW16M2]
MNIAINASEATLHEAQSLSPYEQDIWVEAQREPLSHQFTVALSIRLPLSFGLDALHEAAEGVMQGEPACRRIYVEHAGAACAEAAPAPSAVERYAFADAAGAEAFFEEWSRKFWTLSGEPLVDIAVGRSPSELVLMLRAHHIVADSWALDMLARKILDVRTGGTERLLQSQPFAAASPLLAADEFDTAAREVATRYAATEPVLFGKSAGTLSTAPIYRRTFQIAAADVQHALEGGITPFMSVSAALAVLLSCQYGSERFFIGVPYLNRDAARITRVEQRANTLALGVEINQHQTFREIAQAIRQEAAFLKDRQALPFGRQVSALARSGHSRQLFDATISYLRYPSHDLDALQPADLRNIAHVHAQDAVAVHLHSYGECAQVQGEVCLNSLAFASERSATEFLDAFVQLVECFQSHLDQPVSAMNLLTTEQATTLAQFEDGPAESYSEHETLMSMFESTAARHPHQVAVRDGRGAALSYAQLDAWASSLALALQARGVGRGDIVAVSLERSPRMLAAIFGVLKTGAAYLPIDSEYPQDRIQYMLEDSQAKVVITDLAQVIASSDPRWFDLAAVPEQGPQGALLRSKARPRDPAYVIYTSGSTGRPKGVVIEHHSVINRLEWMQQVHPLATTDVILQKTPVSFDVSVWELFWWSMTGASVALLAPGAQRDPRALVEAIQYHGVTVAHFVPSMLEPYVQALADDRRLLASVASLECLFTSGEALSPAVVNKYRRLFGEDTRPPRLVNLYGPTEATVDVTWFELDLRGRDDIEVVPIGFPINNTSIRIVSQHGARQPIGIPGELQIGGVQLARGYLNRAELTAERFITDPNDNRRWYRSGDLACWEADGSILYLGRMDGQVKIRGNRIELGEIKSALMALPHILNAEILVEDDEVRGKHLIAAYVSRQPLQERQLRQQLAVTLPAFMLPSRWAALDHMPLTPNGKFDRKRALQLINSSVAVTPTAVLDEHQALVAEVWRKVLGEQDMACEDDFYSLGGDSILMLKVRSELEHRGYAIDLSALGEHTTLGDLAQVLEQHALASVPSREALPAFALVREVERKRLAEDWADAYPVSQLQLGLLFHSRERQDAKAYKDVFRYTLKMAWNEAAFRQALAGVVARHPALRTCFNLSDPGRPLQLVRRTLPVERVLAIVAIQDGRHEQRIARHMRDWAQHDYGFAEGPLFNITLFPDDNAGVVDLVLSFHHAILDGGSVANLMRELLLAYAQGGSAEPDYPGQALPSPAMFVEDELAAMADDEHRQYWRDYLDGASNTLPVGLAGHLQAPGHGVLSYRFEVDTRLDAALAKVARASHVPIKLYYLAAHCLALGAMSGAQEVTTGVVTHARPEVEHAEHMLGLFLNTLPIRASLEGSWQALVERLYLLDKRSHKHRRLPLSEIQHASPGITLATAFNYIHFHVLHDVATQAGIEIAEFDPQEETSFAILANVMRGYSGEGVSVRVDMDAGRYAGEQGQAYAELFNLALAGMAYQPQAAVTVGRSLAELGQLLDSEAGQAFVAAPQRIATAVGSNPQAIALRGEQGQWDYARLWREVGEVATRLQARGVTQGDIIGVALPRSFEQIATVVAISAVGAVCLPLDLGYPASRLELIVRMAAPKLIVSDTEVPGASAQVPCMPLGQEEPGGATRAWAPCAEIEAADPAYILFTSGSTGTPKGVAMAHRGLANLVVWQNGSASGAVASTLQYAPMSFDVSFQEIFATLGAGATLQVIAEDQRRDPAALLRYLDQYAVERVFLPYVALQQLAETAATLDLYPRGLRVIGSSGEQLRVTPEIRALMKRLPASLLENQYGPTETHVVTSHAMSGDPDRFPALPPIGRAIDGVGVLVLDSTGQVLPDGVPGEICVFGEALANGYHRAPDETAAKFVRHGKVPGGRYYRTGDIGIRSLQGQVISLGRNDAQVKVRGYRVEPSEIELKILEYFEALGERVEVAVVARPRDQLDAYLVAYLVGDAAQQSTHIDALRAQLAEQLPAYMVPSHIVAIERMPTTPSGKRDDAQLRALEIRLASNRSYREAIGAYETQLCQLAAELLKLPSLAPEQSIFDCGATSLTAMRIVVLVEKLYGINVPLSAFVSAPTMEKLAQLIEQGGGQFKFDPLVPLRQTGERQPLFLVHPMGGNILSYLRMLPHLPADQPFYALQASGVDAGSQPVASVEAQAALYIEAMRRVQPQGPYLIGGWSYGGFVAFEIANQLIQAGEQVSNVLVLDTMALSDQAKGKASDDGLLSWFFWELLWTSRGSELPVTLVPEHIEGLQARFDYITDHAIAIGAIPAGSTKAVMQRLFEVYRNNWDAATEYNYLARRPAVDITLVRAKQPLPRILREMHDTIRSEYNDPLNGWTAQTSGQVRLVEVEGDHLTIMEEPFVGPLVAAILADIQQGTEQ